MLRGITFAYLSYYDQEDFFFAECKKHGINFYIIDSKYFEDEYLGKFDEKNFIQGDIYTLEKYDEESVRLAKLLVDMNINILVNFHNDTTPFAYLLREKMRKYVTTLDNAKQKEIYCNYNCYIFNKNFDYTMASKLINKMETYKIINDNAKEK